MAFKIMRDSEPRPSVLIISASQKVCEKELLKQGRKGIKYGVYLGALLS
jgi:hypothetical protein